MFNYIFPRILTSFKGVTKCYSVLGEKKNLIFFILIFFGKYVFVFKVIDKYQESMRHLASYIIRHYFTWLPDEFYLRILYWIETGKILHLYPAYTFQEKIQWLKLYNRCPEYCMMVDKIAVKKYVATIIGEQYIIPTLGIWNSFEEINFDKLPNSFVLKTASGGGSCGVVVCSDKNKFDKINAKKQLEFSLNFDIFSSYREWPYKNVVPRILAEKFISNGIDIDLPDYKFFCFNGDPLYCQLIRNRHSNETIDFYDTEWNHLDFVGLNPKSHNGKVPVAKPLNYGIMLEICKKLSRNIPFVRIDLYNIQGAIYFGEITFYPASGFGRFEPEEWNNILGNQIII